jgi:hypothetical protein
MTTVPDVAVSTAAELERSLIEAVRQRPYRTLGAAAGIGYLLGGGLRSPLTGILFTMAARIVAQQALRELSGAVVQRSARSATDVIVPRVHPIS